MDPACNLLVEQGDLRPLDQLDPSQCDGFRLIIKLRIPVIVKCYNLQNESENSSEQQEQWLQMSVLQKRRDNQIFNVKVELKSEEDLFLHLTHISTVSSFENFKKKHNYNMKFKEFAGVIVKIFQDTDKKTFILNLNSEGAGTLVALQKTPYKVIELLEINLMMSDDQKVRKSIIFRFNFQHARLDIIQRRIAQIYDILRLKNPSLLALIQRTVGNGSKLIS